MRARSVVSARKRHKKIILANKGYRGPCKNVFRRAMEAWMKAGQHAYKGRKLKKREFRSLWITRLSNALRLEDVKYSIFINQLKKQSIELNRKMLSEIAVQYPVVFKEIVKKVNAN